MTEHKQVEQPRPAHEGRERAGVETSREPAGQPRVPVEEPKAGGIGRWALAAGGAALAALFVYKRTRPQGDGVAEGGVHIHNAVTVNKPAEELYTFWRNFENLPRFMSHLESVHNLDATRSHWKAKAPAGMNVEWDAEIVRDQAPYLIEWRSVEGASVPNQGLVVFKPAPGSRGAEVHVDMVYDPPAGKVGAALVKLLREDPEKQVSNSLRQFKALMETGEIATTEGQPHGQRSIMNKVADAVTKG